MNIDFAPLEGITGYIYRGTHHKYYPGVRKYYTPFLAPGPQKGLGKREIRDVLPEHNEGVFVVPQLLTNRAEDFLCAARLLASYGYREVNLNLGCPSGTVTAKKKGSGFLAFPEELDRFLDAVFSDAAVAGGELGVSVKTRIGKESPDESVHLMEIFNRYPLAELIVHPRTQTDFYKNRPNLGVFRDILSVSKNPVVYNGDIFSLEDFQTFHAAFSQVETVMLGRGLVANPGLAGEILRQTKNPCEPIAYDLLPTFLSFHDELLAGYREMMSGDRNALFRMKELWTYMIAMFPDGEKYAKKIRKSTSVEEYQAAVAALLAAQDG